MTVSLALSAVLGLALAAALWWAYFGAGDDERAEQAMLRADPATRPALALAASALGVTVSVAAEMALLTAIVAVALMVESRGTASGGLGGVVPPQAASVGA